MPVDVSFGVSEFVAVLNQTLEYAYPSVTITGELANFRVSKNRWVYFDLKDEAASVRFFGTVYQLPGPLDDGMMLSVRGQPRLHPLYGFSVSVQNVRLQGEGSIKKAAQLLERKLAAEGLFDAERKRPLPYPPRSIGLITSGESAAYRDFIKVIGSRWGGMDITLIDVQVQGEAAVPQLVQAVRQCNQLAHPPDVLVMTRGGGSADDLQAFSTEQVTRAIAASRIPTLVAIGHEIDISLAERAADQRASTPSNAAELLVPDRKAVAAGLQTYRDRLAHCVERSMYLARDNLNRQRQAMDGGVENALDRSQQQLALCSRLLQAFNPQSALERGYALVRKDGDVVSSGAQLQVTDELKVRLHDATVTTTVKQITME